MQFTIEGNDDGFLATCPQIEGAFAEGDTQFDALYNLLDVIKMIQDYQHETAKKKSKKRILSRSLRFRIPITV